MAGTVTLILDGDAVIVVDPGMVASREALLAALAAHGPQAGDVTDVVFSHHHPDHTVNAALFPAARIRIVIRRVNLPVPRPGPLRVSAAAAARPSG